MSGKKQAVVVVHGMGEQQPMQTIRDFVKGVWMKDPKLDDPHFWNKPSSICQSLEQRRLTTNDPLVTGTKSRLPRTDFFEYYWAHHTVDSTLQHLKGWFFSLIWRNPRHIISHHPLTLLPIYLILWLMLIFVVTYTLTVHIFTIEPANQISAAEACSSFSTLCWQTIKDPVFELLGGAILAGVTLFLVQYFGDVARYVRASPANIEIRQNIRQGGIELLERIHKSGEYDRIILVGHSLGSIIAYDILNHLWARHNKFEDEAGKETKLSEQAKLLCDELCALAKDIKDEASQANYRHKQHQLFTQLTVDDNNNNWLISDFITLGSPLTYADVLLFSSEEQFMWRKLDREYPTSPPVLEEDKIYYAESFMHHAAVFAPVRWTNIYSKTYALVFGDIISGPVSPQFSYQHDDKQKSKSPQISPIKEIELKWRLLDGFTHTKYWQVLAKHEQHLINLRKELNLINN